MTDLDEAKAGQAASTMWVPGANPKIDDDLMADWLGAVLEHAAIGLTGEKLSRTLSALVDHLSAGNSCMIAVATDPQTEKGATNV